nr:unnamed protein product [Spirometra erinaceieuropaei]
MTTSFSLLSRTGRLSQTANQLTRESDAVIGGVEASVCACRTRAQIPTHNPWCNRPERRTALVTQELALYKMDIAALSEGRFSEQGQLEEVGSGHTFFWSGRPKAERLNAGVIASTASTSDEERKKFYEDLLVLLADMLMVLGGLNAHVVQCNCEGVPGPRGIAGCNEYVLLLLTACAKHPFPLINIQQLEDLKAPEDNVNVEARRVNCAKSSTPPPSTSSVAEFINTGPLWR